MWAGARCSAVALVQGRGPVPPGPGVAAPGAWLGAPSPRPGRDMPYTPLFLRGNASLSRSKPDAVSLVPRGPLWVSSARSPRIPASPFFYASSLRSLLSPRLSRCARHRCAVFFRTGLSSRRINHSMLPKSSTIFVTSAKWLFTLIPCVNHI